MKLPYWTTPPEPEFDISKLLPAFESPADAKIEWLKRIYLLEKGNKQCQKVAERLKKCRRYNPCKSPACPKCNRKYRTWYTGQILKNIAEFIKSADFKPEFLTFVTIVPIDSALLLDELLNEERTPKQLLQRHKDRIRNQFTRAKLNIFAFGGFEADLDVETQSWELHTHIIVFNLDKNSPEWLGFLQNNGYNDEAKWGDTPVQVNRFKNYPEQVSYTFKSYFSRKEKWRDTETNKKRCKKFRLRPAHERISLVFLNQLDFEDRTFLYKARRYSDVIKMTSVSEKLTKN